MELHDAVRRRRMMRSFTDRPLDPAVVDRLLTSSLRAPSAGNTRGTAWLVLEGSAETGRYWEHVTTPEWRRGARRWAGLSQAPLVALSLTSPAAYVARYAEPDKSHNGRAGHEDGPALGEGTAAWAVPYWFGDAAFATMTLLLAATDAGLGACFLGNFRGERPLLGALGVPDGWRLFGAVLLGHPGGDDVPSASLAREGPSDAERVHRGRW